jgi:hypothetical protein
MMSLDPSADLSQNEIPQDEWVVGLEFWAKEYLKGEGRLRAVFSFVEALLPLKAYIRRPYFTCLSPSAKARL